MVCGVQYEEPSCAPCSPRAELRAPKPYANFIERDPDLRLKHILRF